MRDIKLTLRMILVAMSSIVLELIMVNPYVRTTQYRYGVLALRRLKESQITDNDMSGILNT
jgi:hypothetical protein